MTEQHQVKHLLTLKLVKTRISFAICNRKLSADGTVEIETFNTAKFFNQFKCVKKIYSDIVRHCNVHYECNEHHECQLYYSLLLNGDRDALVNLTVDIEQRVEEKLPNYGICSDGLVNYDANIRWHNSTISLGLDKFNVPRYINCVNVPPIKHINTLMDILDYRNCDIITIDVEYENVPVFGPVRQYNRYKAFFVSPSYSSKINVIPVRVTKCNIPEECTFLDDN